MKLEVQNEELKRLYDDALAIMNEKGPDYAPSGVAFEDVTRMAHSLKVDPSLILWIYLQKHLSALRKMVIGGTLTSESVHSRAADAINLIGLLYVWFDKARHEGSADPEDRKFHPTVGAR